MRRILSILLVVCMVFTACAQNPATENSKSPDSVSNLVSQNSILANDLSMFKILENRILLKTTDYEITLEPETLKVTAITHSGDNLIISEPVMKSESFTIDEKNGVISYADMPYNIAYGYGESGFFLTFMSKQASSINWPQAKYKIDETALILPLAEGSYIPLNDKTWLNYLTENSFNTLDTLSMPFWGIENSDYVVTYMVDYPFHNELSFNSKNNIVSLNFAHTFSDTFDTDMPIRYYINIDKDASPITPAKHFRKYLESTKQVKTLEEKAKTVDRTTALIGAPHAYIWSNGSITTVDVKKDKWIEIAKRIINDKTGPGTWVKSNISSSDWNYLIEVSKTDYPYKYLMQEMARILSDIHIKDRNFLVKNYADCFNPPASWGGGISTKMIDALKKSGLDKFVLCTQGWEQIALRPQAAAYAEKNGYLLGTYDSFHSIHDPNYAGTDQSWPTAQFGKALYETGFITGKDGKPLHGFKQFGYKLSPVAARPFVEKRVTENFKNVPYSYYFVDCDAFGECYDDYTPGRMISQRQDVEARLDRLNWISKTFDVPIGSEGGNYMFAPTISIAEGIFTPVIGWDDPDMKNKQSPFYLGKYYPPDEPEIFFEETALKEEYIHLYFDPRFRLPLYEAVFHDSVITSAHWGYSSLKFSNVRKTTAITEILYQVPPLYHLNLSVFEKNKDTIVKQSKIFGQTHSYSYRFVMQDFKFLTADRSVQMSIFGNLVFVANYSASKYVFEGSEIPSNSILIVNGKEKQIYTP